MLLTKRLIFGLSGFMMTVRNGAWAESLVSPYKMDLLPTGDITIYKSQLFRACGAPTAADRIRNPDYRPAYSYGLARPISMNSPMQAWLIHGCRPGLS